MRACLLTPPLEVRLLTYSFIYHRDFPTLRPRNRLSDRSRKLLPDDPLYILALLPANKQIRTETSAIVFDHIAVNIAESGAYHRDGSSYWEVWDCDHYEARFISTWRLPQLTHSIKRWQPRSRNRCWPISSNAASDCMG